MGASDFDPAEHLTTLRRYARSLARDPAQADDLVQDALVRAYEKRHTFRGEQLRGWLLAILHSTFLNDLRRSRREAARVERLADIAPTTSEPAQDHAMRLRQVADAFAALPEDQRAALHLVTVEGLAYADAAAVMQIPVGTLMSRLARGREALRRLEAPRVAEHPRLRLVGGLDERS